MARYFLSVLLFPNSPTRSNDRCIVVFGCVLRLDLAEVTMLMVLVHWQERLLLTIRNQTPCLFRARSLRVCLKRLLLTHFATNSPRL